MRSGDCCDMSCVAAGASGEANEDCPDINLDGVINVNDILDVLSAFGGSDPAADITDDGTVNVNDLLGLLSKFGTECTVASGGGGSTIDVDWIIKAYEPMTAAVGDTVTFTYSDYHNVFLQSGAAGQAPCDPSGATQVGGNTDSPASFTFTEAGAYTFACHAGSHCDNGQIVTFTVGGGGGAGECNGCCPPGADCFAPDPACCAERCASGDDCGGQEWTDCGSPCAPVCGQGGGMICAEVCMTGFFCPRTRGGTQSWDPGTLSCVEATECSIDPVELPPGIAIGRPFTLGDMAVPAVSGVVEMESDWAL